MKSTPITYTKEMILARKAGLKTQTRRLIPFPEGFNVERFRYRSVDGSSVFDEGPCDDPEVVSRYVEIKCRYGGPGDELWVQEAYWIQKAERTAAGQLVVTGVYLADDEPFEVLLDERESSLFRNRKTGIRKASPARFMYRSLSRGLDRITEVRVQRVNEISEADAIAEGIERHDDDGVTYYGPLNKGHADPVAEYRHLWNRIHTKPGETWADKPFVFPITFEVIR